MFKSLPSEFIAHNVHFTVKLTGGDTLATWQLSEILCVYLTRAINLLPNRVIGCIGQHPGEPIEELAKSWDSRFLASSGHDQLIKFWDISSLPNTTVNEYRKRKKKDGRMKSLTKKAFGENDFFSGLLEETEKKEEKEVEEEEEDDDDDDESDSGSD